MDVTNLGIRTATLVCIIWAAGFSPANAQVVSEQDFNKLVVMSYMEALSTSERTSVESQVLSPAYREIRSEFQNMSYHAAGSELAALAEPMRVSIPDRREEIDIVMAEGDMVAVRYRISGTHQGNFYGIPATGAKIDVDAAALFWLVQGKIVKSWFMADEARFLRQIGQSLPARQDGRWQAAPILLEAVSGDEYIADLLAGPLESQQEQNKLKVAAYKSKNPPEGLLPETGSAWQDILRHGFSQLAEIGSLLGAGSQNTPYAFPDRLDVISNMMAEGKWVMIQFRVTGTNTKSLHGIPALGRSAEVWEIAFAEFDGEQWKYISFFGDELGMLLQLGGPQNFWFTSAANE